MAAKRTSDADMVSFALESEKMWHRRWLLKYGVGAAVVLMVVGGLAWRHMRQSADRQEADAKQEALHADLAAATATEVDDLLSKGDLDKAMFALAKAQEKGLPWEACVDLDKKIKVARAENTTAEVKNRILKHEYEEAGYVLQKARERGLPHHVGVELDEEIVASARKYRGVLLDDVEAEIAKRSVTAAKKLLSRAESLRRYSNDDRANQLGHELRALEGEAKEERFRSLIEQSREAAGKEDFSLAIQLLDEAGQLPYGGPKLDLWERQLREMVGGRLRVDATPPSAAARIAGYESAKVGDVIHGLKPGEIELVVEAPGYVPEIRRVSVSYPNIVSVVARLAPEAPAPLWATQALTGRCGQRLVADYYLRKLDDEGWRNALKKIAKPGKSKRAKKKGKAKLSKGELSKVVRRFLESDGSFIQSLDELGEFSTSHPGSTRKLLRIKKCASAIGQGLHRIEKGCATCLGEGAIPCPECRGQGKRREMRPCKDCSGKGDKIHSTCKGTGSIKCKRCKGKGQVTKSGRRRSGRYIEPTKSLVNCTACRDERGRSTGTTRCLKCRGGIIQCTTCRGTGRSKSIGECSACNGKKGNPCSICEGTGDRVRMKPDERREIEHGLAALIDSGI